MYTWAHPQAGSSSAYSLSPDLKLLNLDLISPMISASNNHSRSETPGFKLHLGCSHCSDHLLSRVFQSTFCCPSLKHGASKPRCELYCTLCDYMDLVAVRCDNLLVRLSRGATLSLADALATNTQLELAKLEVCIPHQM